MNHELRWDLLVPELLKHDTDDHEILDVVRSNDEAGRWYFLHRSNGYDRDSGLKLRSDRTSWAGLSDRLHPNFCRCGHGTLEREATEPGVTGNLLARSPRFSVLIFSRTRRNDGKWPP